MKIDRKEVEKRKLIMRELKEQQLAEEEERRCKKKWFDKEHVPMCYENVYFRGRVIAVEKRIL